ncbi:uncharacterized protein HKW66_Vig0060890 [Vigna angularis]|uniref:Uncharacterized protein n=1 Tax=Phaseolus angularis TaxID=3914 RepID=A0A8T0L5J6_PHAAN|nr:uncharacterized protein HKW66_Vig0060890 [Vigna angularis]
MVSSCPILHLLQTTTSAAHSNSRLYHNAKNYKSANYKPLVLEVVVLQVVRKCFAIKEMKRGASFRGDAHGDAVILELLRYKFRDFTVALTKLAMASYGGVRVCVGGGGTSIAGTTKGVMERDDL